MYTFMRNNNLISFYIRGRSLKNASTLSGLSIRTLRGKKMIGIIKDQSGLPISARVDDTNSDKDSSCVRWFSKSGIVVMKSV